MRLPLTLETELRFALRRLGVLPVVQQLARVRGRRGYEDRFRLALSEAVMPGDVVWDVGANVGVYTRLFSDWVGQKGSVVGIEPSPAAFQALSDDIAPHAHVRCFQVALGEETGVIPFVLGSDPASPTNRIADPVADEQNVIEVSMLRGDDLRAREGLPTPQVLKIDVEGFEPEALRGLSATLSESACRAVFCEVHFGLLADRGLKEAPRNLEKYLVDRGFAVRWIDASHLGAHKR